MEFAFPSPKLVRGKLAGATPPKSGGVAHGASAALRRLRRLDARVARSFPVQPEELVNGDISSPFTNVLLAAAFDMGGAHMVIALYQRQ